MSPKGNDRGEREDKRNAGRPTTGCGASLYFVDDRRRCRAVDAEQCDISSCVPGRRASRRAVAEPGLLWQIDSLGSHGSQRRRRRSPTRIVYIHASGSGGRYARAEARVDVVIFPTEALRTLEQKENSAKIRNSVFCTVEKRPLDNAYACSRRTRRKFASPHRDDASRVHNRRPIKRDSRDIPVEFAPRLLSACTLQDATQRRRACLRCMCRPPAHSLRRREHNHNARFET